MFKIFTPLIKKSLSTTLASVILATSLPLTATTAAAGPLCANTAAANSGSDPNCAARVIGNQIVTYPRSVWRELARVSTGLDGSTSVSASWLSGDLRSTMGDRNAESLGLEAKEVVSMITMMPTNLPYVFARYNPLTGTLRIDLMKVEHTITSTGKVTGLYSSAFTPQHGNFWKANRQYISPDNFESGTVPGLNPFQAFQSGSSDLFHGVPQEATQVVVGHAMRYAGAPMAIKQVAIPDVKTHSWKHGGVLRKKITTVWTGYLKPTWWLAYPTTLLDRDSTVESRMYCVKSPVEGNCPRYELAMSGVAFEEFKGGMLDGTVDQWELRRETKKGWTLLGMTLMFSAVAFGGFGLMTAVAPVAFGSLTASMGGLTGFGITSEVAAIGSMGMQLTLGLSSVAVFGGANFGGVYSMDEQLLLLSVLSVKNTAPPNYGSLDRETQKLSREYLEPYTVSDFITTDLTSTSWSKTITGSCDATSSMEACGGSTVAETTGIVPRTRAHDHSYVRVVQAQKTLTAPFRTNERTGGSGHLQFSRR